MNKIKYISYQNLEFLQLTEFIGQYSSNQLTWVQNHTKGILMVPC